MESELNITSSKCCGIKERKIYAKLSPLQLHATIYLSIKQRTERTSLKNLFSLCYGCLLTYFPRGHDREKKKTSFFCVWFMEILMKADFHFHFIQKKKNTQTQCLPHLMDIHSISIRCEIVGSTISTVCLLFQPAVWVLYVLL